MNVLLKSDLSNFNNTNDWRSELKKIIKESRYLDTSLVNGIRRYSIGNINTVAFDYSPTPQNKNYIVFEQNNSNMNNDFIGHRIGLLPINIVGIKYVLMIYKIIIGHHSVFDNIKNLIAEDNKSKNDEALQLLKTNLKLKKNIDLISKIEFYYDIENTSEDVINITSKEIKFRFMNLEEDIELNLDEFRTKLNLYDTIFKLYENYNQLDSIELNNDNLVRLIFPLFNYESYNEGVLISKIKKNEKVKCKMYLNIGNGTTHSRFSTVSPCSYSFVLDEDLIKKILNDKFTNGIVNLTEANLETTMSDEYSNVKNFIENRYNVDNITQFKLTTDLISQKNTFLEEHKNLTNINILAQYVSEKDKLLNIFNKCDNQRYFKGKEEYELFKREFNLYIESNGFYNPDKILFKSFKLLKSELLEHCDMILFLLNNLSNYPLKGDLVTIDESVKIENGIDILFNNSNHAIGNILSSYIYYLYDNTTIKYVGYKMVHPLKTEMVITIGLNDITNANSVIIEIVTNLKQIFKNKYINNFMDT